MKVGDKIKTFEVKEIIERTINTYGPGGKTGKRQATFALLLSEKGQERVLRTDKKSLSDCEMYFSTFGGQKYKTWSQM